MASSTASTAARYKVFLYGLVKENIRRSNLKLKPFFGEPEAIKTNPKSLKGLRWIKDSQLFIINKACNH
jgi:hypothetical protein